MTVWQKSVVRVSNETRINLTLNYETLFSAIEQNQHAYYSELRSKKTEFNLPGLFGVQLLFAVFVALIGDPGDTDDFLALAGVEHFHSTSRAGAE